MAKKAMRKSFMEISLGIFLLPVQNRLVQGVFGERTEAFPKSEQKVDRDPKTHAQEPL